ncbi:hypothetical protein MNV49_007981 [Pseudohyphozyma bogoriensis]|nr:hypothetical protein MNV49_007981 [Pseudohyphozyma bogoriensis]
MPLNKGSVEGPTEGLSVPGVYTSTSANRARNNFGLKRPLPQSSSSKAPFIRVSSLDSPQRRTQYRQATKETKFVKKWSEAGVGLNLGNQSSDSSAGLKTPPVQLQSRFVPAGFGGEILSPDQARAAAEDLVDRAPNVLEMADAEFERFLASLGDRQDEFVDFLREELAKQASSLDGEIPEPDLWANAQKPTLELDALVERFLARPSSSSSSAPSTSDRITVPHPHPTLSLLYSSPTLLESSLAPPIPGRILANPNTRNSSSSGTFKGERNADRYAVATILGQLIQIQQNSTAGAPATTFFPDGAGVRTNQPGRASFTLTPDINANISYEGLSEGRGSNRFIGFSVPVRRYQAQAHEPAALSAMKMQLNARVQQHPPRPLPGTQEYSGWVDERSRYGNVSSAMGLNLPSFGGGVTRRSNGERMYRQQQAEQVAEQRRNDSKLYRKSPRKNRTDTSSLTDLLGSLVR